MTDAQTAPTTETPREVVARLRTEHTATLARIESAKTNVSNLRNLHTYNVKSYGADTPENEATLERGEQALLSAELKLEDLRAELKKHGAAVAAEERAKNAEAARAKHTAKIAALSEPQAPRAQEQVAAAEAALATAQSAHAKLQKRVGALKEQAAKQDGLIKQNADAYAAALVAGTTPPELLPRVEYAEVLKRCASELEAARSRVATASAAVNRARDALAQAEASDAYATVYATIAPILEAMPHLPAHPSQWDGALQVQCSSDHIAVYWYRPHG